MNKYFFLTQLILGVFIFLTGSNLYAQGFASPGVNSTPTPIYVNGTTSSGIYIGRRSGTTGSTAIGQDALLNNSTGTNNSAVGFSSVYSNTVGSANSGFGANALQFNVNGNFNTAIGAGALYGLNAGAGSADSNTALGRSALYSMTTGNGNLALGESALGWLLSGNNNVGIGHLALATFGGNFTLGNNNVGIGYNANVSSGSDYQLSIQNVIYGRDMQSGITHGNVSIGTLPALTPVGSIIPGVYAKLKIAGNNTGNLSTSTPSLQLDYVPVNGGATPTPNPTGRYLFRDAGGVVCEAPIPAGGTTTHTFTSATNTLTSEVNGIIRTAPAVNTVVNVVNAGVLTTSVNGVASAAVNLPNINLYNSDGTLTGPRAVNMNNQNLWFNTSASPNNTDNGRIYIGATPLYPASTGNYRLYVEGGVLTEKVKVAVRASVNWADYVFADSYTLLPIKELASFVKKNKHLPGIIAAEDLVKDGLDLGEMQAKQMGKIEELTLYIIDQNTKLEKQQAEIDALKVTLDTILKKSK